MMQRIVLGTLTADANTLAHGDVYPPGAPDSVLDLSDLLQLYQMVYAPWIKRRFS